MGQANEILDCIIAAKQHLPPPPKDFVVMASRLKDNAGQSVYGQLKEMIDKGVFHLPLCPVDFRVSKTVDKVKKWKRLNRPAKTKTIKKEVPAITLIDIEALKITKTEFCWPVSPPSFEASFKLPYRGLWL